ncbi:MAG: hypothetical protein Q8S23_00170 [Bacteroidales bacterium]|nr:hypothetical protein [Bacteroidales bacterium]
MFDQKFDSIRSFIFFKCSDDEMASDIAQDVFTKKLGEGNLPSRNILNE